MPSTPDRARQLRGMVAGANAIIALCCCKLGGRFEDFWEWRAPAAEGRVTFISQS